MAKAARTPVKEPLSRERIEAAALELIEAEGLDGFSTRKLAARLGYEAMSIYHYFPSKGHLMDALIDHVIDEMGNFPETSLPWLERVRVLGRIVRRGFTKRPGLFVFVATHRMNTRKALAFLDRSIALFELKLPHELAVRTFRSVSYYVVGAGLDETAGYARGPSTVEPVPEDVMRRDYPSVFAAGRFFTPADFDATFELGWELMLTGIAALVRAQESNG